MTRHLSIRDPDDHEDIYNRFEARENMIIVLDDRLCLSFRDNGEIMLEVADSLVKETGATGSFSVPLADLFYRYLLRSPVFKTDMNSSYPLLEYFDRESETPVQTHKHDGTVYRLNTVNVDSRDIMISSADCHPAGYASGTLEVNMDPDIMPETPSEPI